MESVSCATRRQRLANAHACECRSNRSVAPYPGAKCKRWWRSWYASEAEPPVVAGRLAIATAFSFGSGSAGEELSSCALVKWCYSATALAALPYVSAHVRVLTDNVALAQRECVAAQGAAASLHVQPFDPDFCSRRPACSRGLVPLRRRAATKMQWRPGRVPSIQFHRNAEVASSRAHTVRGRVIP